MQTINVAIVKKAFIINHAHKKNPLPIEYSSNDIPFLIFFTADKTNKKDSDNIINLYISIIII